MEWCHAILISLIGYGFGWIGARSTFKQRTLGVEIEVHIHKNEDEYEISEVNTREIGFK